jgi:LuxR family maltose regulon positive regulatory protein
MRSDADAALAALPPDSVVRPAASVLLGVALSLQGQDEQADAVLERGVAEAERAGAPNSQVVGLSERALIAAARGDAAGAEALAFRAFEVVESAGFEGNATSAIAMAASARAHLRHGNFDAARVLLAKAQLLKPLLAPSAVPWFGVQVRLELVRAYLALRDRETARTLLAEAREILREKPPLGVLERQTLALQQQLDGLPERGGGAASGLTAAELRLLPLLATHLSFREIGERLYVSRNTIKTQAISVYRKLGVSSRSESVAVAEELGLVESAKTRVEVDVEETVGAF